MQSANGWARLSNVSGFTVGSSLMTFWSGETLLRSGKDLIEPFNEKQIDCNAYTLRMGDQYYRTSDGHQKHSGQQKRTFLGSNESFLIPPGQFAFLLSKEIVKIPNSAMAFISMRTGIKFQGLINVSGFHVDPGYNGNLIYAVYNASPSPIELAENEVVFKIWFCTLDQTSAFPFVKKPDEGLHEITSDMVRGMNKEILSLQNLGKKIADQQPTIDHLYFIWRAIVIIVIGSFIVTFLSLLYPGISNVFKALTEWSTTLTKEQSGTNLPPANKQPDSAITGTDAAKPSQ
jgi:dCTP deaminase